MNRKNNNPNREHYFEIKQGRKSYKVYILTQDDIDIIFNRCHTVQLNNELLMTNSLNAYRLENGEVLVVRQGENEFPLYPSEEVLLCQLSSHNPTPKAIFDGINIYGEFFSKKAPILSKKFLQKCGVDYNGKNDLQILKEVDLFISKNRTRKFLDENFLSLVALVGELINKRYGSNWLIIKSNSKNFWTPYLSKDDQQIFFADFILDNFENRDLENPIFESYQSVVAIIKFNSSL